MKFGIVVFPGSNCDRDMYHALTEDLQQDARFLWHKDEDLSAFTKEDCLILPGGFSYGDYLRSGALARFSPMMNQVIQFARSGGTVLGICNGFQILCESGLLPGALLRNENQRFICRNVHLRSASAAQGEEKGNGGEVLTIPIAHGEGRYYADAQTLDRLEANQQVWYRYCDAKGEVDPRANPNGSANNIAGICNETRNVFGMMPHPERACSPALGNQDGKKLLQAFLSARATTRESLQ